MTLPPDLYQLIFQHSLDGVLVVRLDGTVLRANDAACRMLGRSEEEIRRLGRQGLIVMDDQVRELLHKREADGTVAGELSLLRADGGTVRVDFVSGVLPTVSDEGPVAYSVFRDVTARRALEEQLRRSARALRLRTACSAVVVRATSEPELFAGVCLAMVEVGGYRMAWVGLADDDERKTLRPAASAGHDDGFLAEADMVWADIPHGQSPCGLAVRSGHLVVNRDFDVDPALAPWREAARARGYRSSTALPLVHGGRRVGVLGVYAATLESFDAEELGILAGLADDVACGALALRSRRDREVLEEARRASDARVRLLADCSRAFAERGHDAGAVVNELARRTCEALADECRVELLSDDGQQLEAAALSSVEQSGHQARDDSASRATLGVQLRVHDRLLGSMELTRVRRERPAFTDDDRRVAQEQADRAALTMHNARLFVRSERLAAAVDQASELVMITDANGLIRYVNPAFEATTGYSRSEVIGKNPRLLKSGVQDAGFYRALWETLTRGETWHGRLINRKKDGSHYTEDAVISPVRDAHGVVTAYVGLKRDITRHLSRHRDPVHGIQSARDETAAQEAAAHSARDHLGRMVGRRRRLHRAGDCRHHERRCRAGACGLPLAEADRLVRHRPRQPGVAAHRARPVAGHRVGPVPPLLGLGEVSADEHRDPHSDGAHARGESHVGDGGGTGVVTRGERHAADAARDPRRGWHCRAAHHHHALGVQAVG